jgi:N-acetylmuramic acid 6-phosphate etherase
MPFARSRPAEARCGLDRAVGAWFLPTRRCFGNRRVDAPALLPDTELTDPRYQEIDAWPPAAALAALFEAQLAAAAAARAALPSIEAAVDASLPRLTAGGRMIYAGAGTSGRLAVLDAVELGPTFNWPAERQVLLLAGGTAAMTEAVEGAEDDADAARHTVAEHAVGPCDVALGVAASGRTRFTCAVLAESAVRGALTVAVANSASAPLLTLAAHPILVETGPEPIAGSTRLKAGTAQKIVLNLFSTLLMLRLGRVHAGQMVDLRAGNAKLRARALRILRDLTRADAGAAEAALTAAQGNVKTAVLLLRGLDLAAARERLAQHGGRLRAALKDLPA